MDRAQARIEALGRHITAAQESSPLAAAPTAGLWKQENCFVGV